MAALDTPATSILTDSFNSPFPHLQPIESPKAGSGEQLGATSKTPPSDELSLEDSLSLISETMPSRQEENWSEEFEGGRKDGRGYQNSPSRRGYQSSRSPAVRTRRRIMRTHGHDIDLMEGLVEDHEEGEIQAIEGDRLFFKEHAKLRAYQRGIKKSQVARALVRGKEAPNPEHDETCKIVYQDLIVIVRKSNKNIIITVFFDGRPNDPNPTIPSIDFSSKDKESMQDLLDRLRVEQEDREFFLAGEKLHDLLESKHRSRSMSISSQGQSNQSVHRSDRSLSSSPPDNSIRSDRHRGNSIHSQSSRRRGRSNGEDRRRMSPGHYRDQTISGNESGRRGRRGYSGGSRSHSNSFEVDRRGGRGNESSRHRNQSYVSDHRRTEEAEQERRESHSIRRRRNSRC